MRERELFLAALDIEESSARQAHLQAECRGDVALLARVESLLASHGGQSQFLNMPVIEQIADGSEAGVAGTMFAGYGSTQDENNHPESTSDFRTPAIMAKRDDDSDIETPLSYLEPTTSPDSLGRLGHYEVLEVVGRGAFGTVLRAFDEKLHRVVAIKVMAPELASTSPARKRFIREAQAAAAIRHEHVVSIYTVEEKSLPYLVMEFIPGETLQQRLDARGPFDVPTVLQLGRQIAEGLAAAHAQELIHRDIKPGNILLETSVQDRVKITDFGLARAADDASLTQSGTIAGTPMYMAPEQAAGLKLDQRADLFSFGSVLYQMVSGRPPFRASTTVAVLRRLAEDTPRPIREIIPETPQWLCDIISKLHAKNPDERYQTAREIADVLADCEAQLKAHAGLKDFTLIPQVKSPPARSSKWVAVAVLLCPLLVLGLYAVTRPASQNEVPEKGPIKSLTTDPIQSESDPSVVTTPQTAPPPVVTPFDAAQAKAHQDAWAKYLGVEPEITNSIGMKLRLIPPGEMQLDRTRGKRVSLSHAKPFYAGVHEVSVGLFRQFVTETSYKTDAETSLKGGMHFVEPNGQTQQRVENVWSHPDFTASEDLPVSMVSWYDAKAFCNWLSRKERRTYRLPTDSEWFWFTWAGSTSQYYFGDDPAAMNEHAWHEDNAEKKAHPVGGKLPNPWGLFDVYGNVNELCFDWNRNGKSSDRGTVALYPEGPQPGDKVPVRGLSFHADKARSPENPGQVSATLGYSHIGFRTILCDVAARTAPDPVAKPQP